MPIFGQKNVNSIKNTLYYGPKKVNRMPFFPILNKKITAQKQQVHSLKNTLLSCPYKRPFSQKHGALMSFLKIFHEKALAAMPILGQKNVISVKTTLYYGQKKSLGCSFFQKRPFSKKTNCSHVHILSKKRIFSQKHSAHMYFFFFKFVMENPLLSCPYFVKKTSILSNLYYIMGQKSQQDALFFRFFMINSLLSCPYFVKKTSIL